MQFKTEREMIQNKKKEICFIQTFTNIPLKHEKLNHKLNADRSYKLLFKFLKSSELLDNVIIHWLMPALNVFIRYHVKGFFKHKLIIDLTTLWEIL
jgi:hypothetical protein